MMQGILCLCFVLMLSAASAAGESDADALLELKKGIRTDNSGKPLVSWDSNSLASDGCPKDWYGIVCSNSRVTSITLNDLGLAGELDFSALSSLQMLRNLSVSNNQFSGAVTKDIGSIGTLESLDLSRNLFSGPILLSFDSLKLLKYLDFHSNNFAGDVMSILGRLGAVVYVDLSYNSFSGTLDLGMGTSDFISSVGYLNVSHNNLTGKLFPHDGIPYFDSLEVLDASDNRFVGNVPSFSFVVSLRVVNLRNNQLLGSLPDGLLQESSMILSELDLSHNLLEGPVESITSLNLRNLNLSSNKLSGPLPARIGHCAIIDLSNNMFSGNLSRAQNWGNYIESIDLSSNQLTSFFSNQTSQFLRLSSLKISNNSLESSLPLVLGTYPELRVIDFSLNRLTGLLLPSLFNSTKLTDINLSFNNFSGTIPIDAITAQNYSLRSLNLSHNSLVGGLPSELGFFHSIESLDLSNNLFEGVIPDSFSETMVLFNVSYNNLSGVVPQSLWRFPSSSFHPGNNLLVVPNVGPSPKGGDNNLFLGKHGSKIKTALKAALIAGASLIAILALLIYCRVRGKKTKANSTETGGKEVIPESTTLAANVSSAKNEIMSSGNTSSPNAKISHQSENPTALGVCSPDKLAGDLNLFDSSLKFTPEELSSAPAEAVGTSCHGTLYKAVLSSGCVLAVKLLKEGIAKGRKEFAREAKKLGNIRHPNLVSLQGFYWGPKEHEKLIISKYVEAPCLALYLHGSDPEKLPPLSLPDRLKIALNVSRCLTYLHTESSIPHGNLKSTNILIETPSINVLLTDYSLHRLLTSAGTAEQVLNAGALGYMPPEFTSTAKPCPSLKSDVYAFGVILLELLTGRSSSDIVPGNPEVVELSEWVSLMAAENRGAECLDSRIVGGQSEGGVEEFLHVALRCILPADERPDMRMIFEDLSSIVL